MAETPKTKNFIEHLRQIAQKFSSGKNDEKALAEMRQLLFKNGFSPSDVDMAFMQAQQGTMLAVPSLGIEKGFNVPEMLFAEKPQKKPIGINPFELKVPLIPIQKQKRKNNSVPRLKPIVMPKMDVPNFNIDLKLPKNDIPIKVPNSVNAPRINLNIPKEFSLPKALLNQKLAMPRLLVQKQKKVPSLSFFPPSLKNRGVGGLDFVKQDKNNFSFVPKRPKKGKRIEKLFDILWG